MSSTVIVCVADVLLPASSVAVNVRTAVCCQLRRLRWSR